MHPLVVFAAETSINEHKGCVMRHSMTAPSGEDACCSQVARRTFIRALNDRGSIILVPGGQAELIHTGRLRSRNEFVIYPKHQGEVPDPALLPVCSSISVALAHAASQSSAVPHHMQQMFAQAKRLIYSWETR